MELLDVVDQGRVGGGRVAADGTGPASGFSFLSGTHLDALKGSLNVTNFKLFLKLAVSAY